jgi:hypothetical protein
LRTESAGLQVTYSLPISEEISIVNCPSAGEGKTKDMAKGLFLCYRGEVFAGESAGFGLPVLRIGCRTIFPSLVSQRPIEAERFEMVFQLDRHESLRVLGIDVFRLFPWFVELLLQIHLRMPRLQGRLLKFGTAVRSFFHLRTAIVRGPDRGRCRVLYSVVDGSLWVEVDATSVDKRGRLILLNEVAGTDFGRLRIAQKVFHSEEFPGWRRVPFGTTVENCSAGIAFSLSASHNWQLACGREVARDLNWAGFALTSGESQFSYRVCFNEV